MASMLAGCVNAYSVLAAPSVPSASTGYESISPVSCCAKSDPSGPSDIVNDDTGTLCASVSAPSAPIVKTSIAPGMVCHQKLGSYVSRELTNTERASRSTSRPVVLPRRATA